MAFVRWVVGVTLFVALLFLSLQNDELVTVRFYHWFSWQAPLIFLLLIAFAAGVAECEVDTHVQKSYRGYRFRRDDLAIRLAAEALRRRSHEPTYALSGGAADANVFNERGLACVNLANGMTEIHTPDEHIAVDDLDTMVEVTLALLDAAREPVT